MPYSKNLKPVLHASVIFLLLFIMLCSGCSESTAAEETILDNTSGQISHEDLHENIIEIPPLFSAGFSGKKSFNVLRNKPLTINGNLSGLDTEKVQIWLLDGNITSFVLFAGEDNRFATTLDSSWSENLARNFSSVLIVEYPGDNGEFAIIKDSASGEIKGTNGNISSEILNEINSRGNYPTTLEDYFEQAISESGTGGLYCIYYLSGADGWIEINPVTETKKGEIIVSGTTTLPLETKLCIGISTVSIHPTPKNYDFSHEFAEGEAEVEAGTEDVNTFSAAVNTSRLYSGKYMISVESLNSSLQADSYIYTDIINLPETTLKSNYINWSALSLPKLIVNNSIEPEMPQGGLQIVPPGDSAQNNEVEYGCIIDCGADGICRVFDSSGIQILSVYDSNEMHIIQVPNGAMGDSRSVGNVSIIKLNGDVILTKINEYPKN